MFRNREDAGRQLAEKLKGRELWEPLVLAIPRSGVVIGSFLARELGAELDVVLSRKTPAPWQPELALGAVSEDGRVYLDSHYTEVAELTDDYLDRERRRQLIGDGPAPTDCFVASSPGTAADRSIIVTDDGIATGSTMIAAASKG